MAVDPAVIAALESAVAFDAENVALRLHLAGLLIDADRPGDGLVHLVTVLERRPDDLEALRLATAAGTATSDPRTASWARLFRALSGVSTDTATSVVPPSSEVPTQGGDDLVSGDERDWDRILRDVLDGPVAVNRVTLDDVGGLDDVKERLEISFLAPLRHPEYRTMYGTSTRGGLLLWGPPGCGKTFLARAVAGELGANFVNVGLTDVLDMWLGNSEKQLAGLFAMARSHAPTILFFDELDAIGHARGDLGRSGSRNVVAQLLTELDGVVGGNEDVFVIGATNQPWDVDSALRRPGRFDRTMLVVPPDGAARATILRYHLRDRPVEVLDLSELVTITDGFSGADLRLVCEEASQRALGAAVRTAVAKSIGIDDLLTAARGIRPSTPEWFETARNFVTYQNATGQYDELDAYLRRKRPR